MAVMVLIGAHGGDGPGEVQLDRGQRLAQLIMQFARERGALLFAGGLDACRQPPHLLFGFPQAAAGFRLAR